MGAGGDMRIGRKSHMHGEFRRGDSNYSVRRMAVHCSFVRRRELEEHARRVRAVRGHVHVVMEASHLHLGPARSPPSEPLQRRVQDVILNAESGGGGDRAREQGEDKVRDPRPHFHGVAFRQAETSVLRRKDEDRNEDRHIAEKRELDAVEVRAVELQREREREDDAGAHHRAEPRAVCGDGQRVEAAADGEAEADDGVDDDHDVQLDGQRRAGPPRDGERARDVHGEREALAQAARVTKERDAVDGIQQLVERLSECK